MSKHNNPVPLISVIVVTLSLSVVGIWWANQYGFGFNSNANNNLTTETENSSTQNQSSESEIKITPNISNSSTPTPTPASKKLKTAADINAWQEQVKVKFVADSGEMTEEGLETLNQVAKQIVEFDPDQVSIRVVYKPDSSESSKKLGEQRGENLAGYLRDRGLKHKIIISSRGANDLSKGLSPNGQPNTPLEVSLFGS
jgi:outer membrane protein OmpA-like peptidoglycan-associated protein